MKRLLLIAASVLSVSCAAFLWVVNAPAPAPPRVSTPAASQPSPRAEAAPKIIKPPARVAPTPFHPDMTALATTNIVKQINLEMGRQKRRISADQRAKKLTVQQAGALTANMKSIYGQISAYTHGSPKHPLSPEQASVIFQQLQNNGRSIP
jgi:hypothetical protein